MVTVSTTRYVNTNILNRTRMLVILAMLCFATISQNITLPAYCGISHLIIYPEICRGLAKLERLETGSMEYDSTKIMPWNENTAQKRRISWAHHWKPKPVMNVNFVIQIKICAEYRDMLTRPRLVCQEPGLRPIGRSPGVFDKSSRSLGSMSWYSAQILICFIAYIFHFFYSSVGSVGNFAGLPVYTVPSAIVHCNQNETGH